MTPKKTDIVPFASLTAKQAEQVEWWLFDPEWDYIVVIEALRELWNAGEKDRVVQHIVRKYGE